ncbi:MAG: GNAT family N-acetyltransferase [Lachnospiraceae bacterium]|nr:GNAT family N-acetyltransferase [Lachnospiraceae bacterium]
MSFEINRIRENEIRISDGSGASATVGVTEDVIKILSFYVPEDNRKNGIGRSMLEEVENIALSKNAKRIECDYRDDLEAFSALIKNSGYEISEGKNMVSVNTEDLINSTGVIKSLRVKLPGIETTSFSEMMPYQIDEVGEFLNNIHINMDENRLNSFDERLSCVVYNKDYKIRAVLLTTILDGVILVDLLVGFSKKNPEHVLAVCQEFVRGLIEDNVVSSCPKIVVMAIREEVTALFKRLLDKEYQLYLEAKVNHAVKILEPGEDNEINYTVGEYIPWQEDISDIPYQSNISEKQLWFSV